MPDQNETENFKNFPVLPTEKDGTCGLSSAPGEKIKFFFLNIF
jgi:hypothetical protein